MVTDGSAVLGLGDIGPGAAMPVMEGKAALFKRFADIDAWPICLDTQDVDEIVRTVELIAPGFGGINLEDIAAPRCFEIEERLREKLDIPVFHDDQHGTAIVALAALKNALRVVDKQLPDVKIVVAGGGAAGTAIVHLLLRGRRRSGARVGPGGHPLARRRAARPGEAGAGRSAPTPSCVRGELPDALDGADVFIGVSAGNVLAVEDLARMDRTGDRLPDGQPDAGGRPGAGPRVRRDRGVRPLGPAEPDQQRAGVPGRLPRPARRPGHRDQRRDAARRGRRARRRRPRRPAQRQLHHPERLRPRGDDGGGRRRRRAGPRTSPARPSRCATRTTRPPNRG